MFTHEELPKDGFSKTPQVWYRGSGDFVIVVIDDECNGAKRDSHSAESDIKILCLLREEACKLPDTRAIGFFPLEKNWNTANQVLDLISEWLTQNTCKDTRIYFLVDALCGYGVDATHETSLQTACQLATTYNCNHIAYLTRGADDQLEAVLKDYRHFKKGDEIVHLQRGNFSPELMPFFGMGLHDDKIIDDAIQFYAKPWATLGKLGCSHRKPTGWYSLGWCHDCLEKKDSKQPKALAKWLSKVSSCDLCDWEEGESAKCLMIWIGCKLWERNLRRIQGNVLKVALEKFEIPLSATCSIPDEPITMPCTPCFPFLVSLRSFLLRCKEKKPEVSEVQFIQENHDYIFRLMMKFRDHTQFEHRFRETLCTDGKEFSAVHTFTRSLRYLIHCKTEELESDYGREYMRLFTDGTEKPVFQVEIASDHIDLIW